jgi:hypothetical protein
MAFELTPCSVKRWFALGALVVVGAWSAWDAHAQASGKMKPGLWEISARVQGGGAAGGGGGGDLASAMAMAQQQMQNLPPEQRAQMEAMMKGRGVALGPQGNTVRVCVTREQAEREELPQAQEGCTQQGQRSGKVFRYTFSCRTEPPMSGEGEYTLTSATSASGRTVVRTVVGGRSETVNVENTSTWLGADCGDLKPRAR